MEEEMLRIFDSNRTAVGTAPRHEVHRLGYWHETFHCWFISREEEIDYIYLQIRSESKKEYPGLLDITAAGHLLATETVHDGVREVKEELGIDVTFEELASLGIIDYSVTTGDLIDQELANVYVYNGALSLDDFALQTEEVSGVVRANFKQFSALWLGELEEIQVAGFEINKTGNRVSVDKIVTKINFVAHEQSYYEAIIRGINKL
ncbi:NUDIX hydrolase [Psychrobacillus soli]|uniref:NUDIX hydrolase n=1 Tax=Psychrobacillus soli TaxID=1543965 RepID=A0A544TCZ7_9BACI|nr:NUDIX domain-containing protein [Psychrobacillus soli]TQR15310.1 NUDIX hydrolase [Psychrobacillus soli]